MDSKKQSLRGAISSPIAPKDLVIFLALILIGYAGNYYNVTLFFGVNFLFGSIAVLIATCLYGPYMGAIAAAITSIHTIFLWGHPYAAVIFTVEAFFVGWFIHRRHSYNMVVLDGIFWLIIGIPMVWGFYGGAMKMASQTTTLIMLKQAVNGVFNALIANLVINLLPIYRWSKRPRLEELQSLRQTLLNLLVAFVFIPALLLITIDSRRVLADTKITIGSNLGAIANDLSAEISEWQKQSFDSLSELANQANFTTSQIFPAQSIELVQTLSPGLANINFYSSSPNISSSSDLSDRSLSSLVNVSTPSILINPTQNTNAVEILAALPLSDESNRLGSLVATIKPEAIEQILTSRSSFLELLVTLIDGDDRIIATANDSLEPNQIFGQEREGETQELGQGLYQWLPTGSMPVMVRWKNSFYGQIATIPGSDWQVIVETPMATHINSLQAFYIRALSTTFAITIIALALSRFFSYRMVQPIRSLTRLTTNLPDKLLQHEEIDWIKSNVVEISTLVRNFRHMANILEQKFNELSSAKDELEHRVEERTQELVNANQTLEKTLQELSRTQTQMVQSEKMSSLGQMVAGIAHEINNPVNFIYGNLKHADQYANDLLGLVNLYQEQIPNPPPAIAAEIEAVDLEFLSEDLPKLLDSMRVGAERIQKIVLSLRNFSRLDEAEVKAVNIHEGIDSTLLILHNRLKAKPGHAEIEVIKHYDNLPEVECYAGQLNQVFMNIIANAIDALEDYSLTVHSNNPPGKIEISTQFIEPNAVEIKIADNGPGIPSEKQARLFEPFFTTKGVGRGTGLGLSISYQIITEKHGGEISCHSKEGKGTAFIIKIPIIQSPKPSLSTIA
jgi:two-component system NtrC family sensor kinase